MKRLHLHMGVENLTNAISFYTAMFGSKPVKVKDDYAKWMVDDPRVNFVVSTRAPKTGLDHLGIQVDTDVELSELRGRFANAKLETLNEGETICCYSKSDKSWLMDPNGIAWETYRNMADVQIHSAPVKSGPKTCCVPEAPAVEPAAKACCRSSAD